MKNVTTEEKEGVYTIEFYFCLPTHSVVRMQNAVLRDGRLTVRLWTNKNFSGYVWELRESSLAISLSGGAFKNFYPRARLSSRCHVTWSVMSPMSLNLEKSKRRKLEGRKRG